MKMAWPLRAWPSRPCLGAGAPLERRSIRQSGTPRRPEQGRRSGAARNLSKSKPSERTRHKVARTTPGEFLRQVRAETAKIVWPTRRETLMTGLMVVIMTALLGLFFFGVDSAFSALVQQLLGLLG